MGYIKSSCGHGTKAVTKKKQKTKRQLGNVYYIER